MIDSGGWDGYHFWAPIWDAFLCPVCHPIMPWLIVRVKDNGGLDASALSNATIDFSHELVESATDPFPFFAWLDPLKFPPWSEGEVADICHTNAEPWASTTKFENQMVSTYWSDTDNACVPNSRPIVRISSPANGSTVHWGPSVALFATATDPVDGVIPYSQIRWSEGTAPLIPDGSHMIPTLNPGAHTITATARHARADGAIVESSATTTFTVVAGSLSVAIAAPTDGQSFQVGQQISFAGSGRDSGLGDLSASDLSWDLGDGTHTTGTGFTHAYSTTGAKTITLTGTVGPDSGHTTIHITINAASPTGPPTVSITSPPQDQNFRTAARSRSRSARTPARRTARLSRMRTSAGATTSTAHSDAATRSPTRSPRGTQPEDTPRHRHGNRPRAAGPGNGDGHLWGVRLVRGLAHRRRLLPVGAFGLAAACLCVAVFVAAALAFAGDLDTSFGTSGITVTDLGTTGGLKAVALQKDGKIVVAAEANGYFAVARYTASGVLDTTFATGGLALDAAGSAYAVAVQKDGKIVAVGERFDATGDFALVRYTWTGGSTRRSERVGGW